MTQNSLFRIAFPPRTPLYLLIGTSILAICASVYARAYDWESIYQNLYYFPIIIACTFFLKRGFFYSLALICCYLAFILQIQPDPGIISGALIRSVIFLLLAGAITYHAIYRAYSSEQLLKSEERYRTLFNNAVLGIFRSTPAGEYLDLNPAIAHMYGYESPEKMKSDIHDIRQQLYIHPEERDKIKELLATTGEIRGFETENRNRSGNSIWISIHAKTVRDEHGEILCYEGTVEDITDRKRFENELARKNEDLQVAYEELAGSEEELRQQLIEIRNAHDEIEKQEEKYRKLFESNITGIALHEMLYDTSGNPSDYRFLDVNPAYEEITGLSAKDIIGKNASEVVPERKSDRIDLFNEVAQKGKTVHFENYQRDMGRYYEVTAYSPEKGQFATLILDVTSRKLSEISLAEANSFLENLLANAFSPILVWNPQFRITRVNHACELLTGRSSDTLIGQSLNILFPPEEEDRSMRLIRTTLEGVRWETVELNIQHQDGSVKTVLWNSATIYDPDEKIPIATFAQGRDVTGERQIEQEKRAATTQIQENLAQLAILNDGIRNPLTIIAICAEMVDDLRLYDTIIGAIGEIDGIVRNLDQKWLSSKKILDFLRKHNQIDTPIPHSLPSPLKTEQDTGGSITTP